jgi:hypothetical protein
MTRFCDNMPCKRCPELLLQIVLLLLLFGLTFGAKILPLILG